MTTLFSRWSVLGLVAGLLAVLASGCAVYDGGYGYGGAGYGAAYYEPYGVDYGGWGAGYQVAPFRSGYGRPGGGSGQHAYRSAPASRGMPSIASGSRSGGSRSGGSRSR